MLGHELLQLAVLLLQLPQPLRIADLEPVVLRLPAIERPLANLLFAAQFRRLEPRLELQSIANFSGFRRQFLPGHDNFRLQLSKSEQHGDLRRNISRDPHHEQDHWNVMTP
jgi:hypothetical protein